MAHRSQSKTLPALAAYANVTGLDNILHTMFVLLLCSYQAACALHALYAASPFCVAYTDRAALTVVATHAAYAALTVVARYLAIATCAVCAASMRCANTNDASA